MTAKYIDHEWKKDRDHHVAYAVGEIDGRKFWTTVGFTHEMMEDDSIDKLAEIKRIVEQFTAEDLDCMPQGKLNCRG